MSRFRFVDDHRDTYPVKRLCELVQIARSSYYAWAQPQISERCYSDARLANQIHDVHLRSQRTYGAPRVFGQLRRSGWRIGKKRVARIMAECGLVGAHSRKSWRRGRPNTAPAPDLISGQFSALSSNERWVADITQFACLDGTLYLAGIVDLHDRAIVGWSMGERQLTDLVINALVMALSRRSPEGKLIHHADRGSQYTALEFTNRLEDFGLAASYSRTGNCFDNAAMEAVWATLKREITHIHGGWRNRTRSELRTMLFDYIERFYNRERHQGRLAHRTPAEVYAASVAA